MRIAFIVTSFPKLSQTFILRQVTGLIDLGHDVQVYSDVASTDTIAHPSVARYELHKRLINIRAARDRTPAALRALAMAPRLALRAPRALHFLSRAGSAPYGGIKALTPRLEVLLAKRKYDVVHCHFGTIGLRYRFAGRFWGVPLMVTFYGSDFSLYPRIHGPGVYLPLFEAAGCVAVISRDMGHRLTTLGCPPELIRTVHLGVDPEEFAFRERPAGAAREPVRLLTVARLVEKKGIEYAIRAVAEVARVVPGIRYEIIGDGELRPRLEALVQSLNLSGRVVFRGAQAQGEVRRAMSEADIFLLPSVTAADGNEEGTPTVLIEASACGLPIVSTLHSGIPEVVINGRTGFLVPERDVSALAERLTFLVGQPEQWGALGRAARAHIEASFDIRKLNRQLEGIYRELIAAGAGVPPDQAPTPER